MSNAGALNFEDALSVIESDSLPRLVVAHDAALKAAPVRVLACAPLSPGKAVLMFCGDVASVQASHEKCLNLLGSTVLDQIYLPGVHEVVLRSVLGKHDFQSARPDATAALGIVECRTIAAAVEGLDGALKMARVTLGRLHLGAGFGGKAYFTIKGEQADVEAALDVVASLTNERLLEQEIVAAPHEELPNALFVRPWPLDPSGGE